MATSSERSPPPLSDSEDQDVLDAEDVGGGRADSDEDADDLFTSVNEAPSDLDVTLPPVGDLIDASLTPPTDLIGDPLDETTRTPPQNEPAPEVVSEAADDFVDLTSNLTAAEDADADAGGEVGGGGGSAAESPLSEPSDDFVDILGSESEVLGEEVEGEELPVEEAAVTEPPGDAEQEVTNAVIDAGDTLPADPSPPASSKMADPLVDLLSDPAPSEVKAASGDLFDDEGSDLFAEKATAKPTKQPQKSLFDEPDEDLFGEPLGAAPSHAPSLAPAAMAKKGINAELSAAAAAAVRPPPEGNHGDIFSEEAVATAPSSSKASAAAAAASKTNGVIEDESDIFAEATVELSLDSPRTERKKDAAVKPPAATPTTSLAKPQAAAPEEELEEEAEAEDKFDINVLVTNPEKVGDGMNAYMAYRVSTTTSLSMFRNKNFMVRRRFSDFLGLYEKLAEKHGPNGFIVPPPPEKSILGMTKVKVGKEDSSSTDFVERRRGALERYLQRVVTHPSLLQDPDVREFLERDDLPRAVSTQALSGAGFLKMINKATEAVSKMTIKMNESDVWFEEKLQEVESADQQFRKLHALVESLVIHRKELSLNTASFAKSVAMLGSAEDNTALSRALSQLAEVEDKMEQLHQDQAANDTFRFAELLADFIRLLGAVRGSFDHRMRAWQRWQDAQAMLQKKREAEAKLLWANKPDKLQLAKEEIAEWETKVTQYERDFERVSATVRKEVVRFEREKAKNFRRQITEYLESVLQSQQQLIKYWEAFLPEAKAIA